MLSRIYHYATLAYVGGGFGKGIHNILEPAVYGVPVIFGPRYEKFNEAVELLKNGGAFSIQNENDLLKIFHELENNPGKYSLIKKINTSYIEQNRGATATILDYLRSH